MKHSIVREYAGIHFHRHTCAHPHTHNCYETEIQKRDFQWTSGTKIYTK